MRLMRTRAPPRPESLPWLSGKGMCQCLLATAFEHDGEDKRNVLIVQARMFGIVEKTPADARNVAKYRTPTVLTVARTM